MSKELFERIERLIRSDAKPHYFIIELLTDCQQRIAELEERKTRDMHDLIVVLGERDKRIEELEQGVRYYQELRQFDQQTLALASVDQENARLQGRIEAEAQSGMQSLRTQENLFGAKLDALQAQLEAASGYLGRLLTTVWPQIELCPDLMGICTQIDHLLASLRDNRVKEDKEKV